MTDTSIQFELNDELVTESQAPATTTLLDYLRRHLQKTGTKEGCAEGDCGACTVVMVDSTAPGGATFRAINSCLVLLPLVHGRRLYTVEGLRRAGMYHGAQESLVQELGSQCGYCTPGVVMSMFEACYRTDLDADWKLDDQLCGNLCRCTGYRPIRDAAARVAGSSPPDEFSECLRQETASPTPARALDYRSTDRDGLEQRFVIPTTLEALFDAMQSMPAHRFVVGATDLGLQVTKARARFEGLISLGSIGELRGIQRDVSGQPGRWRVGACTLLADLESATQTDLPIIARAIRFFGSRQIKNRGTVGGNLCNASPIGDLAPVLLALDAVAIIRSGTGERSVAMSEFFLRYRETALQPGEVLVAIEFSQPPANARLSAYKVSKRREMDISAACAGLYVELDDAGAVTVARFGFGGMAATPARAAHAEAAVVGQSWSEATAEAAAQALSIDFTPLTDHRGSQWYRATVAANFLRGFFEETRATPAPRLADHPSGTIQLALQENRTPDSLTPEGKA